MSNTADGQKRIPRGFYANEATKAHDEGIRTTERFYAQGSRKESRLDERHNRNGNTKAIARLVNALRSEGQPNDRFSPR